MAPRKTPAPAGDPPANAGTEPRFEEALERLETIVEQLESGQLSLEDAIARHRATGEVPGPLGSRPPSLAPFQAFRGADGYLVIAAGNDVLFARACEALGRPELAHDARTKRKAAANAHRRYAYAL